MSLIGLEWCRGYIVMEESGSNLFWQEEGGTEEQLGDNDRGIQME